MARVGLVPSAAGMARFSASSLVGRHVIGSDIPKVCVGRGRRLDDFLCWGFTWRDSAYSYRCGAYDAGTSTPSWRACSRGHILLAFRLRVSGADRTPKMAPRLRGE